MRARKYIYYNVFCLLVVSLMASCAIKDDIPFPIVEGAITAFEVEGQCDAEGNEGGTAEINLDAKTVKVYVNDLVDISNLKVKRMEVSNEAIIIKDSVVYGNSGKYSTKGYPQNANLSNLRADFTHDAVFTLHTWQDYEWTVKVQQIIEREVELEGQVGNAVIDPDSRLVIIYVSQSKDLSKIKVKKFSLGGQHGKVIPDPTKHENFDFATSQRFNVKYGWSDNSYAWSVYVYTTEGIVEPTATLATNAKGASVISGARPNGVIPIVEYKVKSDVNWIPIAASDVKYPTSTSYEVVLDKLHTDIQYIYRVIFDGKILEGVPFYFEGEQLENSGFDNWSSTMGNNGKLLYMPWADGQNSYWDTGNKGATTVGASNSTPTDDTPTGEGKAAHLLSKYIVMKFAAGNIFTGNYLETDITNGILSFGRPFSSRPQSLSFDYKYTSTTISRTGGAWNENYGKYISRNLYEGLKGQPDSCCIYIVLADWEEEVYKGVKYPYIIRTRPSELHLMDFNDSHVIAYAQITKGENITSWTHEILKLHYKSERVPRWILVVASSSKYGDYFTGGEGSLLNVDNFKLHY